MSTNKQITTKKKNTKINNWLIIVMLVVSLLAIAGFAYNIFAISLKKSNASGTTVEVDTSNRLSNSMYTIGNNPTDYQKELFQELSSAIDSGEKNKIVDYMVKSFVADYFTWTNKDGNYDIGGVQYIFQTQSNIFIEQSRWEFYGDLDKYITQYGRENLLEVNSVTIAPDDSGNEGTSVESGYTDLEGNKYEDAWYTEVSWTYKNCKLNTEEFQHTAYITSVWSETNQHYEIVTIYDNYD